jgi:hypothetical protein
MSKPARRGQPRHPAATGVGARSVLARPQRAAGGRRLRRQYGERDLSAPEVADAKRAIDLLLRRHEPFPAIVTDRRWNVMQANRAARG